MPYIPCTWQKSQLKPASFFLLTVPCPCFETSDHPQAVKSPGVPAPTYPSAGKPFTEQWAQTCSLPCWAHALPVGRVRPYWGVCSPNGHQPGCPLLAPPRTFSWPGPVSRLHCGQGSQQSRVPSLVSSSLLVLDCPLCAPWTHVWAVGPRIVQVVLLGLLSSPAIYQPGTANGRGQGRKERDSWSQLRTSVGLVPALEVVEDCSGIPAVENSTSLTQQTDK